MIDLDRFREGLEARLNEIDTASKRKINKLKRKKTAEIKKITKKHDSQISSQEKEYEEQKQDERTEFYRRAGGEVLEDLRESYKIMEERVYAPQIDDETVSSVKERLEAVKTINPNIDFTDENKKKATFTAFGFSEQERKIAELVISGKTQIHRFIDSYISSENGAVYLVTPLDQSNENSLAKSLEDKIDSVLDQNKVTIGASAEIANKKSGYIGSASANNISFSFDYSEANGFLVYELTPEIPNQASKLAKEIIEKFQQLQPENFERLKLTHRVSEIDNDITKYFIETPSNHLYTVHDRLDSLEGKTEGISPEETASLLGYTVRGVRTLVGQGKLRKDNFDRITIESIRQKLGDSKKINKATGLKGRDNAYQATNPTDVKKEALARLDQYGDELRSSEVANVLGYTDPKTVPNMAKVGHFSARAINPKMSLYSASSIREFLESRQRKSGKWVLPK